MGQASSKAVPAATRAAAAAQSIPPGILSKVAKSSLEGAAAAAAPSAAPRSATPAESAAAVVAPEAAASPESPSSPSDATAGTTGPPARSAIHEKNETTVSNVGKVGAIEDQVADVGQRQVEIWKELQKNPRLLDSPRGLEISSQQRAILESRLSLPAAPLVDPRLPEPTKEARYGRLESALAVAAKGEIFPPRPPEAGPGDQLILAGVPEHLMLDKNQLFEIYAKHRSDPDKFTPRALAELYETEEAWVRTILQYTLAPTFVEFEASVYGVYEVRDLAGKSLEEAQRERIVRRAVEGEREAADEDAWCEAAERRRQAREAAASSASPFSDPASASASNPVSAGGARPAAVSPFASLKSPSSLEWKYEDATDTKRR